MDRDPAVESKINALLTQMTLEEKIGQMNQEVSYDIKGPERLRTGGIGSIIFSSGAWGGNVADDGVYAEECNRLQREIVEHSRLKIPAIIGRDVIHGHRTVFPIPLGQAATWEPELIYRAAQIAAREARTGGLSLTFTPMLDIARDPRWGRIAEGFGEDPYLCSALARSAVRGYQGNSAAELAHPDRIAACAKHFLAYGAAEGGRDYEAADVSMHTLREVYLPPFQAAVEAGVAVVMAGFNEIGGMPISASAHLLNGLLKDELGFKGFVVSDWNAVYELVEHGVAADCKEAAIKAVMAGIDMDMVSGVYRRELPGLVREGGVPISAIDSAVRRILRVKMRLGLFEKPYVDTSKAAQVMLRPDHLAVAREAAAKSIVLLKNDGGLLPIGAATKKILVVGPYSDAGKELFGTWTLDGQDSDATTVLEGIRAAAGGDVSVTTEPAHIDLLQHRAREVDLVIAVIGEHPMRSGEANCVADLALPPGQEEWLEALAAAGTPVVAVVISGRPLTLGRVERAASAVLFAWHPGIEGGNAVADLLFGKVNPSAKLPVTMPHSTGQVPIYYAHTPSGRPVHNPSARSSRYLDAPGGPLHPFGFGLSYTSYRYANLEVDAPTVRQGGQVIISADITNTGARAGEEIVQLYLRDVVASMTRPVKLLRGFQRVALAAGQTQRVKFTLTEADLSFIGADLRHTVEPGKFKVWIGPDSAGGLDGEFELLGS